MLPRRLSVLHCVAPTLQRRRAFRWGIVWVVVTTFITACAGTRFATEDPTVGQGSELEGIRYYNDAPFVLVYTDGKGGLSSKLIWLPDTTQVRILRPYAWASKNNSTYKFVNGVLTEAKSVVDETIVPVAVLTAAKDVVLAKFPSADSPDTGSGPTVPPPALFRVVVNESGVVSLRGVYGKDQAGKDHDINITVSQPAKKDDAK